MGTASLQGYRKGHASCPARWNISQRDWESSRCRDYRRAARAGVLLEGEIVDLSCVGGPYVAVGRSQGDDARISLARGDPGGKLQPVAGELRFIDDALIRRLGLQDHVEGQWIVGARYGEAIEPGIVIRHAPYRHGADFAAQSTE